MVGWLVGMVGWLELVWLLDLLVGSWFDWLIGSSVVSLLVGWLVGWLVDCLVG